MTQQFSLLSAVRGMASDSFRRVRSTERDLAALLEAEHGPVRGDPGYSCRVPANVLSRDLTAGAASAGGYLTEGQIIGYAPALQPHSVVLRAGATVIPITGGLALVPRGTSGVTTTWLATEATPATENQSVFGTVSASPNILAAYVEVSRQLLLQSNAEAILRRELTGAAAAALDAAALCGSGASGQPLGITSTPGIGSVSGSSLAFAGIVEFQADVAAANAGENPATCAFVTTPTVSALLKQRQRFAGVDSPLWSGPLTVGTVDDVSAYATNNMTAGRLLYGDFAQLNVITWDGLAIEVDPFTKMQQAIIGVRLLLPVDIVVRHPAAFSLAASVT